MNMGSKWLIVWPLWKQVLERLTTTLSSKISNDITKEQPVPYKQHCREMQSVLNVCVCVFMFTLMTSDPSCQACQSYLCILSWEYMGQYFIAAKLNLLGSVTVLGNEAAETSLCFQCCIISLWFVVFYALSYLGLWLKDYEGERKWRRGKLKRGYICDSFNWRHMGVSLSSCQWKSWLIQQTTKLQLIQCYIFKS